MKIPGPAHLKGYKHVVSMASGQDEPELNNNTIIISPDEAGFENYYEYDDGGGGNGWICCPSVPMGWKCITNFWRKR